MGKKNDNEVKGQGNQQDYENLHESEDFEHSNTKRLPTIILPICGK